MKVKSLLILLAMISWVVSAEEVSSKTGKSRPEFRFSAEYCWHQDTVMVYREISSHTHIPGITLGFTYPKKGYFEWEWQFWYKRQIFRRNDWKFIDDVTFNQFGLDGGIRIMPTKPTLLLLGSVQCRPTLSALIGGGMYFNMGDDLFPTLVPSGILTAGFFFSRRISGTGVLAEICFHPLEQRISSVYILLYTDRLEMKPSWSIRLSWVFGSKSR